MTLIEGNSYEEYKYIYILPPSKEVFKVITTDPNQIIINTVVNTIPGDLPEVSINTL